MNSGTNIPKSKFLYVCILTIMWHSWFCKLLQELFTLCCTVILKVKQGILFFRFSFSPRQSVIWGTQIWLQQGNMRISDSSHLLLPMVQLWLPLLFVDNVILIVILVIAIIIVIVSFQLNYSVTFLIYSIGYDQIVFSRQFNKREMDSELWTAVWLFR